MNQFGEEDFLDEAVPIYRAQIAFALQQAEQETQVAEVILFLVRAIFHLLKSTQ